MLISEFLAYGSTVSDTQLSGDDLLKILVSLIKSKFENFHESQLKMVRPGIVRQINYQSVLYLYPVVPDLDDHDYGEAPG
jgi:hypothetical protein